MKNIAIFIIFMLFFSAKITLAIDWVELRAPSGRQVFLDKDSIKSQEHYYFYNIKYNNRYTNKPIVVTMQSAISSPFSARLRTYGVEEYNSLEGDYENITKNLTHNLEPVTYESIVNTCYKKVKYFENIENTSKIIIK